MARWKYGLVQSPIRIQRQSNHVPANPDRSAVCSESPHVQSEFDVPQTQVPSNRSRPGDHRAVTVHAGRGWKLVCDHIQPHHVSRPTGCASGRLGRFGTAPSSSFEWCVYPHLEYGDYTCNLLTVHDIPRRYEPLLVAGKHYISTSIDDLGVALEWVASRPDTWRRRVARKGQAAIQALLAERSILCYVRLATDLAASRSPASASLVCPPVQPGKVTSLKGAPR